MDKRKVKSISIKFRDGMTYIKECPKRYSPLYDRIIEEVVIDKLSESHHIIKGEEVNHVHSMYLADDKAFLEKVDPVEIKTKIRRILFVGPKYEYIYAERGYCRLKKRIPVEFEIFGTIVYEKRIESIQPANAPDLPPSTR